VSPAEANLSAAESPDLPPDCFEFLIDSGANVCIFRSPRLIAAGTPVNVSPLAISGVSLAGGPIPAPVVSITIQWANCSSALPLVWDICGGATTAAHRNIICESGIWDLFNARVFKEPDMHIESHGITIPITRRNGLYFTVARLLTDDAGQSCLVAAQLLTTVPASLLAIAPESNATEHAHYMFRLWCTRLGLHTERSVRAAMASMKGLPFSKLTESMLRSLREDEAAALALIRRSPAGHGESIPPTLPGQLLIVDGLGHISTPSIADGCTYEMNAICAVSNVSWSATTITHTTADWIVFLDGVIAVCKQANRTVERIRFDRAPDFTPNAPAFDQNSIRGHLLSKHGIIAEFAPRNTPQGIAKNEQSHDPITRRAEMYLRRSNRGRSFFLAARAYARWSINRRCSRGSTVPRITEFDPRVTVDVTHPVAYLFGTRTPILVTESERGAKGGLGRAKMGVFIGVMGSQYIVIAAGGHRMMLDHISPTDEHLILINSQTPTGRGTSVATQTDPLSQSEQVSADDQSIIKLAKSSEVPKLAKSPEDPKLGESSADTPLTEQLAHSRGDALRPDDFAGLPSTRTRGAIAARAAAPTEAMLTFVDQANSSLEADARAEAWAFQVFNSSVSADLM